MGTDIHQEGNAEDVGDELLGCAMHAGGSAPTDITQTHRSGYYETMYVHTMIHIICIYTYRHHADQSEGVL